MTLVKNDVSDVSFSLNGHFSGGTTIQGIEDTPIREELSLISQYLSYFKLLSIMVDDVRSFNPSTLQYINYPKLSELIQWADQNKLFWNIEHDIFIATNRYNVIENYSSG